MKQKKPSFFFALTCLFVIYRLSCAVYCSPKRINSCHSLPQKEQNWTRKWKQKITSSLQKMIPLSSLDYSLCSFQFCSFFFFVLFFHFFRNFRLIFISENQNRWLSLRFNSMNLNNKADNTKKKNISQTESD